MMVHLNHFNLSVLLGYVMIKADSPKKKHSGLLFFCCSVVLSFLQPCLEKSLTLGKTEGGRRRGQQRMRWLNGTTDLISMSLSKLQELVMHREAWHAAVHGITKSWTWLSNWTELSFPSWGSKDWLLKDLEEVWCLFGSTLRSLQISGGP